jgi:hypothetical protein
MLKALVPSLAPSTQRKVKKFPFFSFSVTILLSGSSCVAAQFLHSSVADLWGRGIRSPCICFKKVKYDRKHSEKAW